MISGERHRLIKSKLGRVVSIAVGLTLILFLAGGFLVARTLIPRGSPVQSGAPRGPNRNGEIAFASDRSGTFQIYTVNADGTNLRQLTSGSSDHTDPVWSPDGTRIAYREYARLRLPGTPQMFTGPPQAQPPLSIYVMNADGSGTRDLTPTPSHEYRNVTWSPDSSKLAFECSTDGRDSGNGQICVANADGSDTRRIAPTGLFSTGPVWSPDGRWIAVVANPGMDSNWGVYLISPDGTLSRPLAPDANNPDDLVWSPDGRNLAFTQMSIIVTSGTGRITIIGVDGSNQHDLDIGNKWHIDLTWSADGTHILFTTGELQNAAAGISSMNSDGTDLRTIVPVEAAVEAASWSSDRQEVAYTRGASRATPGADDAVAELYVVRLDGSAPVIAFSQTLAQDKTGFDGNPPAWRPEPDTRTRIATP